MRTKWVMLRQLEQLRGVAVVETRYGKVTPELHRVLAEMGYLLQELMDEDLDHEPKVEPRRHMARGPR